MRAFELVVTLDQLRIRCDPVPGLSVVKVVRAPDHCQRHLDDRVRVGGDEERALGVPGIGNERLVQIGEDLAGRGERLAIGPHVEVDVAGGEDSEDGCPSSMPDLRIREALTDSALVRCEGGPRFFGHVIREDESEQGLAAGYGSDNPDRLAAAEFRLEAFPPADVPFVDVDVHEWAQLVALVEQQVSHGECAERGAHRGCLELELLLPARLLGEERGQENRYHSATSTESTAGRWRAASIHSSPSFGETKIEPLFVPK